MINRNFLTQVNQDSGSLTAATTVVHKFPDEETGAYKGLLLNARGVAIAQFTITVGRIGRGREASKEETKDDSDDECGCQAATVEVDLTKLQTSSAAMPTTTGCDCDCCGDDDGDATTGDFEVSPGGYVVFRVPAGAAGGYAVELYKAAESGRGEKVFDSRALDKEDTLAVILIRPGTYSVTNTKNGAKGELKVTYPENIPRVLDPVRISCTSDAIRPETLKVYPTQGIVFGFETPSRVKIDLVTPEDRPRPSTSASQPATTTAAAPTKSSAKRTRTLRLQLAPRTPRSD